VLLGSTRASLWRPFRQETPCGVSEQSNLSSQELGAILPRNQAAADTWNAGGEAYERISLQITDGPT
jgi:hypothetical protein